MSKVGSRVTVVWGGAVAVTVTVVLPVMPKVAVIVAEPAATPVARPEPLVTDAIAGKLVFQITDEVIFLDKPLEYVPVAVNCKVVP